jgi:hypothetical protein
MSPNDTARAIPLNLEVTDVEAQCKPGCGTSTTHLLCTCPVSGSTAESLFTSKTSR